MTDSLRSSPIAFDSKTVHMEERDGWRVALDYRGDGQGPYLVDLSHLPRWDIRDRDLARLETAGVEIPADPNAVSRTGGLMISRMNRTQCQVWALDGGTPPWTEQPFATEITDGQALVALVGAKIAPLLEGVTSLDLFGPRVRLPRLFQGPVLHIPCQVVRLDTAEDTEAVLIGFSRGYGQAVADALLASGAPFGLTPGGEHVFKAVFD